MAGGSGGEELSALGDEAFLLGWGEVEDGAGAGWKFVEGEGVGGEELLLPLGGAEDVPALGCYPEDAGHVRGGDDAFDFEQVGVAFGAGGVGDDRFSVSLQIDQGEHFSADGFVADPEDEVGSPLHGLDGVGKGEDVGADAFGVDGVPPLSSRCWGVPPPPISL